MHTKLTKRTAWAAAGVALLLLAGVAQAALQDRDLNGDKVTDAFYDTDLNITWLRNANVNGLMYRDAAVSWAEDFSFAGYTDWRLPASDTCSGYNCIGSEMGHLWYIELGNSAGAVTNLGDFQNVVLHDDQWSGLACGNTPGTGWLFGIGSDGLQSCGGSSQPFSAMAVHPGDVGVPVPEPETYALMLAGLAALAVVRRQRPR
jgi:hypothetical protein